MLSALDDLAQDVETGRFAPVPADEDVHSALERGLLDRAGAELGGKLRAGRSRNDQVATLYRMYLRDRARSVARLVTDLQDALVGQAAAHPGAAMPGRTHFQHAQPVLLAHHLAAHAQALARDVDRIRDWDRRAAVSPYGSGALAGSSLGLDPAAVAAELGFTSSSENSIDGTASRDFAAELAFVLAMLAVDVSRWAEEVIVFTTAEFGYAKLHDAFATGSSIMPQKKNPGHRRAGQGQGRPVDRQSDRAAGHPQGIAAGLQPGSAGGQGAADRLGGPAGTAAAGGDRDDRDADLRHRADGRDGAGRLLAGHRHRRMACPAGHSVPGGARGGRQCVALAESSGRDLDELTDEELAGINPALTPAVREVLTVAGSLASRDGIGGTAPNRVAEQLDALRERILRDRTWAAG